MIHVFRFVKADIDNLHADSTPLADWFNDTFLAIQARRTITGEFLTDLKDDIVELLPPEHQELYDDLYTELFNNLTIFILAERR